MRQNYLKLHRKPVLKIILIEKIHEKNEKKNIKKKWNKGRKGNIIQYKYKYIYFSYYNKLNKKQRTFMQVLNIN